MCALNDIPDEVLMSGKLYRVELERTSKTELYAFCPDCEDIEKEIETRIIDANHELDWNADDSPIDISAMPVDPAERRVITSIGSRKYTDGIDKDLLCTAVEVDPKSTLPTFVRLDVWLDKLASLAPPEDHPSQMKLFED